MTFSGFDILLTSLGVYFFIFAFFGAKFGFGIFRGPHFQVQPNGGLALNPTSNPGAASLTVTAKSS